MACRGIEVLTSLARVRLAQELTADESCLSICQLKMPCRCIRYDHNKFNHKGGRIQNMK